MKITTPVTADTVDAKYEEVKKLLESIGDNFVGQKSGGIINTRWYGLMAYANIEIGAETKILAKAMIKQIDRVIGDLIRQVEEFRKTGGQPICVGIVGVNFASTYTSYEGDREYPTDGKKHQHPVQEAVDAESRVITQAAPSFDEFQILRFKATNVAPFPFDWVNHEQTAKEYSALLVRLSREYDRRFP